MSIPANTSTNTASNTPDPQPTHGQQPASGWRGFALCYGAGLALLLVTTGALKFAFATLG
ncbi:hypothetical protein A8C75_17600 [Marinobacterium aestuarii]|uniref:Uncharacterized protein n=1 Tax=Marinobacterium aestuarii TaxID=1821621 RepID=A0A1A9F1L0_9GAMM|nr:hypothetical protein [Marinobacterium aestuarii]ANG64106.1 hypothetical protein A8C75_17600 [Marinobacterium aestuarii]